MGWCLEGSTKYKRKEYTIIYVCKYSPLLEEAVNPFDESSVASNNFGIEYNNSCLIEM